MMTKQQNKKIDFAELTTDLETHVNSICSALLYHKLFNYVRERLILGDSFDKIQSELHKLNEGDRNCDLHALLVDTVFS